MLLLNENVAVAICDYYVLLKCEKIYTTILAFYENVEKKRIEVIITILIKLHISRLTGIKSLQSIFIFVFIYCRNTACLFA